MSPGSVPATEPRRAANGEVFGEGERELWKAINAIHRDYEATLLALGKLTTAFEKDQSERRSFAWLKLPVWLGVLAWCALAAVEVWARLHG